MYIVILIKTEIKVIINYFYELDVKSILMNTLSTHLQQIYKQLMTIFCQSKFETMTVELHN